MKIVYIVEVDQKTTYAKEKFMQPVKKTSTSFNIVIGNSTTYFARLDNQLNAVIFFWYPY